MTYKWRHVNETHPFLFHILKWSQAIPSTKRCSSQTKKLAYLLSNTNIAISISTWLKEFKFKFRIQGILNCWIWKQCFHSCLPFVNQLQPQLGPDILWCGVGEVPVWVYKLWCSERWWKCKLLSGTKIHKCIYLNLKTGARYKRFLFPQSKESSVEWMNDTCILRNRGNKFVRAQM